MDARTHPSSAPALRKRAIRAASSDCDLAMILTRGTARAMRGCGAFKIFVNGFLRGGWVELARSFKRLRENNMRKQMFFFEMSSETRCVLKSISHTKVMRFKISAI